MTLSVATNCATTCATSCWSTSRINGLTPVTVGWISGGTALRGSAGGFWVSQIYSRNGATSSLSHVFQVSNFYLETRGFVVNNSLAVAYPTDTNLAPVDVADNRLHAIVGVFTGSLVKFFKDGSKVDEVAFAGTYDPGLGGGGLTNYGGSGNFTAYATGGSDSTYPSDEDVLTWFASCKASRGFGVMPGAAATYQWAYDSESTPLIDSVGGVELTRTGAGYLLENRAVLWAW